MKFVCFKPKSFSLKAIMGIIQSAFPVTAQDVVLSYLRVIDAKQLMVTNKDILWQIRRNRPFWVQKAKEMYEKDPSLFIRLKDPSLFSKQALVKHVCKADAVLQGTFDRIRNGRAVEGTYEFASGAVECLAVDEKACLLLVQLHNYRTEIFDLRRFGDPPLRVIIGIWITDVALHGNLIFYRNPKDHAHFHADVFNWKVNVPMTSLEPRWKDMSLHLSKSDQFLIAYDRRAHCVRAYPLVVNGYEKNPIAVLFQNGTILLDMAIRKEVVLTILLGILDGSHHFKSFKVGTNAIMQQFAIESPTQISHLRISFPFILIAEPPHICSRRRHAYSDYGRRIYITGDDHRPFGVAQIHAICSSERETSIVQRPDAGALSQFIFIDDGVNERTNICHVGEVGSILCRTDTANQCWPLDAIVSFGLSVIFARQHYVVFRRYAEDVDNVLPW